MKIGSIVKLSRPYSSNEDYKDALGIILRIYPSVLNSGKSLCVIRFVNIYNLEHIQIDIYQHRVDLIKE